MLILCTRRRNVNQVESNNQNLQNKTRGICQSYRNKDDHCVKIKLKYSEMIKYTNAIWTYNYWTSYYNQYMSTSHSNKSIQANCIWEFICVCAWLCSCVMSVSICRWRHPLLSRFCEKLHSVKIVEVNFA